MIRHLFIRLVLTPALLCLAPLSLVLAPAGLAHASAGRPAALSAPAIYHASMKTDCERHRGKSAREASGPACCESSCDCACISPRLIETCAVRVPAAQRMGLIRLMPDRAALPSWPRTPALPPPNS